VLSGQSIPSKRRQGGGLRENCYNAPLGTATLWA